MESPKRRGRVAAPSNADSVLPFLSELGLNETAIATLLSHDHRFLCASVEETLRPRMSQLEKMGFSLGEICHLLVAAPRAFRLTGFERKLEFLMEVFGSFEVLSVFVKRNRLVLSYDVENVLLPKISILQHKCGLSACQISMLLRQSPRLLSSNIDSLCARAEELGFDHKSSKFWQALCVVCSLSQSTIDEKFRLLQELGFSEAEVKALVQKEPMVLKKSRITIVTKFEMLRELGLSEAEVKAMIMKEPAVLIYSIKKMKLVIEFLATKMGYPKSYVAQNPVVLHFSLQRRLIPRYYVLETLKSRGVPECEHKISTILVLSEKQFLAKFVTPYKESIPGLHEDYVSASGKGLSYSFDEMAHLSN
jgi:mTERF domain-containing protein, mitochondrial